MTLARGSLLEKRPWALLPKAAYGRPSLALPFELRRLDRIRAAIRRKAAVRSLYRAAWRARHPWLGIFA